MERAAGECRVVEYPTGACRRSALARGLGRGLLLSLGFSMAGCADIFEIVDDVRSQHGSRARDRDERQACAPHGFDAEGADVVIDPGVEFQRIGMSILRVRIPYDPAEFELEVPSAQRAVSLGATVMASPWTPPPSLKTNGDPVGGTLPPESARPRRALGAPARRSAHRSVIL